MLNSVCISLVLLTLGLISIRLVNSQTDGFLNHSLQFPKISINRDRIFSTKFSINWDVIPNVTYNLVILSRRIKTNNCREGFQNVNPSRFYTQTTNGMSLTPCTPYQLYLCVVTSNGSSSEPFRASIVTGPPPPSNFSLKSSTPTTLDVTGLSFSNECSIPQRRLIRNFRLMYYPISVNVIHESTAVIIRTANVSIENLKSNTNYNVTIFGRSEDGITSDIVSVLFKTVPGSPKNISNCKVADKTTEICLTWTKPDGGDAIEDYIVQWMLDDNKTKLALVPHTASTSSFTYRIADLLPGYDVNVTVFARNSAGNGTKATLIKSTYPEKPLNFTFMELPNQLFVNWKPPSGKYDEIVFELESELFKETKILNDAAFNFIISNLTANTVYNITIYSLVTSSTGERVESSKYVTQARTAELSEPSEPSETTPILDMDILIISTTVPLGVVLIIILLAVCWLRKKKSTKKISTFEVTSNYQFSNADQAATQTKSAETRSSKVHVDQEQDQRQLIKEDNRVIIQSHIEKDKPDYANGNLLNQEYITIDAPKPSGNLDFWKMIWKEEIESIVTFCPESEISEGYWPETAGQTKLNDFLVEMKSSKTHEKGKWIVRKIGIIYQEIEREITQFHFLKWVPDCKDQTEFAKHFLLFVNFVQAELAKDAKPVIVQCRTSSGKSDIYIAVDVLLKHWKNKVSPGSVVNILNTYRLHVLGVRNQKDFLEQNIPNAQANLKMTEERTYENLKTQSSIQKPDHQVNILPSDEQSNPYYTNLAFLHQNSNSKQEHLENSILNFWKTVWNENLQLVVTLCSINDKVKEYWPIESKKTIQGDFVLELMSTTLLESENWVLRKFTVTFKGITREITQIQLLTWFGNDGDQTTFTGLLLRFATYIHKEKIKDDRPLIVQSRNGSGRSGIYIAIDMLIKLSNNKVFAGDVGNIHNHYRQHVIENKNQSIFQDDYYSNAYVNLGVMPKNEYENLNNHQDKIEESSIYEIVQDK